MFAAANGHAETVNVLLEKGAEANIVTSNGKTALAFATEGDHAAVVALLTAALAGAS